MMMKRRFLASGALMALIATIFGALGAHAFKSVLTPDQLESFKTATQYQFYHALALIAVGIIYAHWPDKFMLWSGYLFLAGILIFSGSIYILSTKDISHIHAPFLGPLTPVGGLCFMTGWISFIVSLFRMKDE